MSEGLCSKTTSLSLGILFAMMHIVGTIGILLGSMKYVEKLHFIVTPYTVSSFSIWTFLTGIILAFMGGFIIGFVFTHIYNYLSCSNYKMPKTTTRKARR